MAKELRTEMQKGGGNGPGHPVHYLNPLEDMERLFEGFFGSEWPRPMQWEWPRVMRTRLPFESQLRRAEMVRMPHVDVIDRETDILVRAELAGVDKKDLDISVSDNTLTLRGCTREESKEEEGDYYRCEIAQGEFARTMTLPCAVDGDKAKASFTDGILELVLPKLEPAKRRAIKVE
ncbi:MAG: Hsp20/alpha crystallin family protein [Gammaproteobacteria bacterium]|nr:Hsp20/alpha crystallin family protein [Gammaproteobacteria bacterium]